MTNSSEKVFTSFKALAANREMTGVSKDDVFKVPLDMLLEEPGFNPRDYNDPEVDAQVEAFAKAYELGHFVPPCVVRIDSITGEVFLVEGHTRTRGAKRARDRGASIERLVCVPFRGNVIDRHYTKHTSQNGLKFKPVAVARDYLKLLNMGQSVSDIAKGVHQSVTHIQSMLELAAANPDVHELVNSGAVSASTAIEVVRKHGEKAGEFLSGKLQEAIAQGKTSVKAAAVKEWAPPRKVSLNLFSSITPVFKAVAEDEGLKELLARTDDIDPAELEGKTVTLSAASVLALCRNFQVADQLKNKRTGSTPESHPGDGEQADEA
jgi:ParB family transcriptional regulator, chromosome partitioning protein